MLKRLLRVLRKLHTAQSGIATIPMVVVGASGLLAAVTLTSGLVSSGSDASQELQKQAEEAIQNIQSTFVLKSALIGKAESTGPHGTIGQLELCVSLALGGGSADFTPPKPSAENNGLAAPSGDNAIIIGYTDRYQHIDNLYWMLKKLGSDNGNNLLETGEMFLVTIGSEKPSRNGGNLVDALDTPLSTNTEFTIEIKNARGINLSIQRRTPASFDRIVAWAY